VTFDPHPRTVLSGNPLPLLTSIEERADAVEAFGIDRFVVVPFTTEFSQLSPEAFVRDVLVDRIGLQEIVVGYDHRFGRGGAGDVETLRRLSESHDFSVKVISAKVLEDEVVSSSRLRRLLLEEGDVQRTKRMLGRPYRLHGRVVKGEGRGRSIGYPTANLAVDGSQKVIPRRGVYAVRVQRIDHSESPEYGGMMNIGFRPTFTDEETLVPEVHLFDCSDELYGEILRIAFQERIRDEISFDSVDELVEQLGRDEQRCKEALGVIS
jgi:riboflavin kinase/FMN adenylyltransferase